MVGTSETGGVLGVAVERLGAEREVIASEACEFAERQSMGDKVADSDSGWGSGSSAFADYNPTEPGNMPVTSGAPAGFAPAVQSNSPANVPLALGSVELGAGNTGTPKATGVPVITNREMEIKPK